jgi:hypothetical protein
VCFAAADASQKQTNELNERTHKSMIKATLRWPSSRPARYPNERNNEHEQPNQTKHGSQTKNKQTNKTHRVNERQTNLWKPLQAR